MKKDIDNLLEYPEESGLTYESEYAPNNVPIT